MEAPDNAGGSFSPLPGMRLQEERDLKYWEPDELRPLHYRAIVMSASGMKNREIAPLLGISEARLSVILNHPDAEMLRAQLVARMVEEATQDTRELINAHTREAFLVVRNTMRNSPKEELRLKSAFDILDRGGFKPREVHVNANLNVNSDAAALLRQAAQESMMDLPEFQEVDSMADALQLLTNSDGESRVPSDAEADRDSGT